ncbi:pyridoxamine 5'-phosphate oxidase family protein [Fulvivirgaceae bacterium BMA10]|uniref:Pyridoxamine 5'-phosphate oxidase family protein n=1 Tax=Splendidivirga corallicola TaxID=3051826 RepID=A0ABT8KHQ6_9BACT|nr:pyridoxamine 5'-phosphate oxidase family protein [Fulvivirgaceae bacterium BMA10]
MVREYGMITFMPVLNLLDVLESFEIIKILQSIMIKNFTDIAFTDSVKKIQEEQGSLKSYEKMGKLEMRELFYREKEFIEGRDGFYMSTVSESGWPYVQFRGGPRGFLKVLSSRQLGFADFRGNRQYISTGNLNATGKAALILMDYARKMRLKIWAETEIVSPEDKSLQEKLVLPDYKAKVERFILLNVQAYDWNCPQHITPRFTMDEFLTGIKEGTIQIDRSLVENQFGENDGA